MSEKFVVGQWVTRNGVNWKVKEVGTDGDTLMLEGYGSAYADVCFLFLWQVGRTYRTTLDGVTATVVTITTTKSFQHVVVDCKWRLSHEPYCAVSFNARTGRLVDFETRTDVPHLLPYLADEPPPVADAATFSEFKYADECDDVNHPTHYTQHPSGVECIAIAEAFNFNVGNAIKYLWRAGLKGDSLEDLRKAAWYVQREIERRERSGQ